MTTHRPYDDAKGDFQRIMAFLAQDYQDREGHYLWSLGRFADWKFNLATPRKWVPTFLADHAHLWLDASGDIVGLAINEDIASTVTLLPCTRRLYLVEEMLDWATEAWRPLAHVSEDGTASLFCNLNEFQTQEAEVLATRGWEDLGPSDVCRRYDVAAKAAEPLMLDEDYRIVSMAQDPNFLSKKRLYQNAWHEDDPVTDLDLRLYAYVRTAPVYDPSLDFSVVAPNGDHVAGCLAFPDLQNGCAEIERVATHSTCHRRGFAEAVIRACFRELHQRGFGTAFITGAIGAPSSLYAKLGATEAWNIHTWRHRIPRSL